MLAAARSATVATTRNVSTAVRRREDWDNKERAVSRDARPADWSAL
jgi:hypothetical protein